jgi:hypothetical protein
VRAQTNILLGILAVSIGLYLFSRTAKGQAVTAAVAQTIGDALSGPRGIRNNNAGNIERSAIQWQGSIPADQVQAVLGIPYDPTFEQMATPADGVRMIGHVLRSKATRGLTSVDAIIRDYSATDQDAYVRAVTTALGLDPDSGGQFQTIDVTGQLPTLALAIIQQENGEQPYDPAQVAEWVYT